MHLKRFLVFTGLITGMVVLPKPIRADIQVAGGTAGSAFYKGTTNQGVDLVASDGGILQFTAGKFGPQSSNATLDLGSFYLGCGPLNLCNDNYQPYNFKLALSFQVPLGTTDQTVTGDVSGKLKGVLFANSNTVGIDFVGPVLFTYSNAQGSGQFYVTVNNIKAGSMAIYGNTELTGSITGATFSPVPEPGSIVLLGTVLFGLSFVMRKKLARPPPEDSTDGSFLPDSLRGERFRN
jgi:hypothetical protein